MDLFVKVAKEIKPIIKKTAVLGITGIKKVLVNAVNRLVGMGIKAFKT